MSKTKIFPLVLGLSLFMGAAAKSAPIDLAALGLVAAPGPFANEAATTSLLGGVAFSSDTFTAPVTFNIAVSGSLPFGGTDFAISAFPVAGVGTLTGASSHVGWDVDLVQVLLNISANTGVFSGVSSRVMAEISGTFGADPIGAGGGQAILGNFVPSTMTLTSVNQIPLPAALPLMAFVLGRVVLLARRNQA